MAGLNWPGLLQWSTKYHDGTAPSNFKQMSDEDKKFLQKAMEEAMSQIEDPNTIFKEAIDKIKVPSASDAEVATSLEIMDRCCDSPDVARNVEKLDGLQALLDLVGLREGALRLRTLEILALLLANNPSIQEVAGQRGALKVFLKYCGADEAEVRAKAFRAIVALARGVEAVEVAFVQQGGAEVLLARLGCEEDARVREKALSFVRSLVHAGRLETDDLARFFAVLSPLVANAGTESVQHREILAACAAELLRTAPDVCPAALVDCLRARVEQVKGSEEDAPELSILLDGLSFLKAT